ncbi:hypothetical protein C3L33_22069, partial [Rhododendron williamsianum]
MSFQDLQNGAKPSPSSRNQPSQAVAAGIFQINTAVSGFRRLVDSIGTAKDTPDHRLKLRNTRQRILQLVKETSAKLKSLTDSDRGANADNIERLCEMLASVIVLFGQEILLLGNEIAFNEAIMEEREQGIRDIQEEIGQTNEIFKDLAVLVYEQGVVIDDIQSNIEDSSGASTQARVQLSKASKMLVGAGNSRGGGGDYTGCPHHIVRKYKSAAMAALIYHIFSSSALVSLGLYHVISATRNHLKSPRDYSAKPYHPFPSSSSLPPPYHRLKYLQLYLLILCLLVAFAHQALISTDSDPLLKGRTPVHFFTSLQSAFVILLFLLLSLSLLLSETTSLLPLPTDLFFGALRGRRRDRGFDMPSRAVDPSNGAFTLRAVAILDLVFVIHVMFVVVIVMVTYAAVVKTVGIRARFGSYEALPTAAAVVSATDSNHIQMKALTGTQA